MLPALDYKRIFLAVLLVVISLGLLVGIFWLVFLRSAGPEELPEGGVVIPGGALPGTELGGGTLVGPGGTLPGTEGIPTGELGAGEAGISDIASGSLTQVKSLVDEEVKEVNLSTSGFNFLSGEDDKFYRLLSTGGKVQLTEEEFPYVESVSWSADGNKVILEYPDGANIVYDFTQNKKVTLPQGLEDPAFDNSSKNIAYKYIGATEEDNWLVVSDVANTEAKAIEPIGDQGNKVQVSWSPNNQIVALYHDPVGLSREEVIFIGLNDENFRSLIVEGSNFEGKWSPDGSKILYDVIHPDNNYNPVLWIVDGAINSIGNNNFNLGLSTWIDKCVFASATKVYCAVPVGLPQGAGLYPDLVNDKPDVFYEINLKSGISKLIAYPVFSEDLDEFQVKKLFISEDGSRLYFWDNWTGKLYDMRLR